ncbi:glycosyltransferase [Sphingomonas immobilis]|uniref:Glycosyltransferase n=1 Tax=Sphingomonas immobilis TaxID=3063997 RepID=A0ABT9A227_9SPHN|nr:glycosyltransferase [Sphingomonas sp. CA1-15]MDO7842767.1 glycosyltransferase [Sphingomonas sp. CA1-15]
MSITREILDPGLIYLAMMSLCTTALMAITIRRAFAIEDDPAREPAQLAVCALVSALVAALVSGVVSGAILVAAVSALLTLGIRIALPRLTIAGAQQLALLPLGWIVGTLWTYSLFTEAAMPTWMLIAMALTSAVSALLLGLTFAVSLARQAVLTHRDWRRPIMPADPIPARRAPKVSIHLPAYAEPPEVVIATLNALSRLDYPNFEVLICDNNTQDRNLWMPVEAHCQRLNRGLGEARFRFFHVSPLPGAKAGALNWLLDHVESDADLVAVIDADYVSDADFLSRLTGFFDDPKIGYVQTPHDYRAYEGDAYLTSCYWEYMPNNKIELSGLNEYNAAITIGTMCIVRRDALLAAGKWAEWCLTEDSEVSVRFRELGYDGIYLRDTFGRGLIPENFADYKKQRFRWTAGPVQQLRRHWRMYLPRVLGGSAQLNRWSKVLEWQRGVEPLLGAIGTILGFVGAIAGVVSIAAGYVPTLDLPPVFWTAALIAAGGSLAATWLRYRLSDCNDMGDMLLGEIARMSLTHIQMVGGFAGFSAKPLAWRRTPKFRGQAAGLRALTETMPETLIGLAHVALAIAALALRQGANDDVGLLIALGATVSGVRFLCAPVMALLSERRFATTAAAEGDVVTFPVPAARAA